MAKTLLIDSTNVVTLSRLKDETSGEYIDDATATLDLYTDAGDPVSNGQGITMTVETNPAPGRTKYRGTLPASVSLTEGSYYEARVTAVATDASQRTFYLSCKAVKG